MGDWVIGVLGEEDDHPLAHRNCEGGRAEHRGWVADVFAQHLAGRGPDDAEALLDLLVVATDVYTRRLLRRDRGHTVAVVHARVLRATSALIAT